MVAINRLNQVDKLVDDDIIPIWDAASGRTRAAKSSTLKEYIGSQVAGVKGGTFSNGVLTLENADGSTVDVPGFNAESINQMPTTLEAGKVLKVNTAGTEYVLADDIAAQIPDGYEPIELDFSTSQTKVLAPAVHSFRTMLLVVSGAGQGVGTVEIDNFDAWPDGCFMRFEPQSSYIDKYSVFKIRYQNHAGQTINLIKSGSVSMRKVQDSWIVADESFYTTYYEEGVYVGHAASLNFTGSGVRATKSGEDVTLVFSAAPSAPTLALHFSGIYNDLQSLQDAIAHPSDNMQAIVISPSEKYYHGVGGSWVELAPVGSFHPTYLGVYDTVQDLQTAQPTPAADSLAIVGTTSKQFYLYDGAKWDPLPHTDLPSLAARVTDAEGRINVAEQHLQTLQNDAAGQDSKIAALETGQQSLESNINQKISGIHIEDADNNVYSDINALLLGRGLKLGQQTGQSVEVIGSTTVGVTNGQTDTATSLTGIETLEFPGSTLTTRNNGKIAIISTPQVDAGITVEDVGNLSRTGITKLSFTGSGVEVRTTANPATVEIEIPGATGSTPGSLNIADSVLDIGSANKLEFLAGKILEDGTGGVQYTPYITTANQGGGYELFSGKQINAVWPAKFEAAKSGPNTVTPDEVMLTIDHMAYEPMHKPSFLAYIADETEVIGKGHHGAKGHHDGTLWFENIVVPSGLFIETDRINKKFGIQEADALDPNVSGGTDYLLVFRIHMRGVATEDGIVQIYLYNASISPYEPTGFLMDVNGQPCMVQKQYKVGDELGVLQLTAVVNAKGLQEFTCHVVDTFVADTVIITDRTEGCSGLVIQAITSQWKTGDGLQQFELDTQQNIEFSSHYLGASRMSLGWIIAQDRPVETGAAGQGQTMADGWSFYNLSRMQMGVQGGKLLLQDDGSSIADFHFGRIFSAEETRMLRGHDVNVTVTLTDKDDAYNVALMKWTGKPDEYSKEIFKSRNNGIPVFESGWSVAGTLFVPEGSVTGDHTLAKTFIVPTDANNYAAIIYPVSAQDPITLKLKEFNLDVDPPFIGYAIKEPEIVGEAHLASSIQHKSLAQTTQGYAGLRYTIGSAEIPMPVGEPVSGAADITLDASTNIVAGSQAKGGEGSLQFNADGSVTINAKLNLWSELSPETTSSVQFWWAKVGDGIGGAVTYTQIPESLTTFQVKGGTKSLQVSMKPLNTSVVAGDKLALRAQADRADGAFLECVTDAVPLVKTDVTFNELAPVSYDDPFSGIDVAQFTKTYTASMTATKDVANVASVVIPFDVPDEYNVVVLGAVKELADTSVRPVAKLDWSYSNTNKTLTVSFGETVLVGRVTIGIYI